MFLSMGDDEKASKKAKSAKIKQMTLDQYYLASESFELFTSTTHIVEAFPVNSPHS